jgi:Zn-dependent oligopeptidase
MVLFIGIAQVTLWDPQAGPLEWRGNSDEIRAAHQASQPAVVQAISELGQSQALYQALKALQKRDESFTRAQERAVLIRRQATCFPFLRATFGDSARDRRTHECPASSES